MTPNCPYPQKQKTLVFNIPSLLLTLPVITRLQMLFLPQTAKQWTRRRNLKNCAGRYAGT